MAGINRNSDLSMGSDGCPPIFAIGSTCANVFIEGFQPLLIGNVYGRHPGGGKHCRHTEYVCTGLPNVLISGSPVLLTSMPLSHGDSAGIGSKTVQVG